MSAQLYYVQDTRQLVGNCVSWWCTDGAGYTCELAKAGKFTRERVERMRRTDRPWPVELVHAATIIHVRQDTLYGRFADGITVGPVEPRDWLSMLDGRTQDGASI